MRRYLVVLTALLLGCVSQPDPRIEASRRYVKEVTGDDLKGGTGLRVTVRSATADGRYVRISGTVENRFDEPVEGIRYIVFLTAPGDSGRVMETFRHEAETVLDPGEDRAMRIEIENPIRASSGGSFEIMASPARLGGRDVPPPPAWQ